MKFSEKKKIEQKQSIFGKTQGLRVKLKEGDPLKSQFYFQLNIIQPKNIQSKAWQ